MTSTTKWIALAAALAAGAALCACNGGTPAAVGQSATQPGQQATLVVTPLSALNIEPLPTDASGAQIVALVNGEAIPLDAFQRVLERSEQQQLQIPDVPSFQDGILSLMIEQTLIEQAARERGITVTDAELDAEIAQSVELAGGQDAWNTWLAANFYTPDEFRATLREALVTSRVRDAVTGEIGGTVPHAHARHILVATEQQAADLIAQIQAGADFAALAQQYSMDETSRSNGGDLGWFAEDELLQPALAYAAFTSDLNAVVGPIQTELGYHVLQVLEREDRPVSEARRAELAQARFTNWLSNLESTAVVERYLQ